MIWKCALLLIALRDSVVFPQIIDVLLREGAGQRGSVVAVIDFTFTPLANKCRMEHMLLASSIANTRNTRDVLNVLLLEKGLF